MTKLRAGVIKALERVFAAEIDNHLPFQSKAKIYRALCEEGLLEPMDCKISAGIGGLTITISGYQLTHAGRYAYCQSCG